MSTPLDHVPAQAAPSETPFYVRVRERRERRATHRLRTPEGLEVELALAPLSARVGAFVVDLLLILVLFSVIAGFGGLLALVLQGFGVGLIVLAAFLVRNFYFLFFELFHQGRTPGKRQFHLRVVSRDGRPLTTQALFVRNVTRDLELFLPLAVLIEPSTLWENAQGWGALLSSVWLFLFALMPLFNAQRLRVGDLLAGTVVVTFLPRRMLFDDPAIGTRLRVDANRPLYTFSPEQLAMYGVFELQVLEELLYELQRPNASTELITRVVERIKTKIGWDRAAWEVSLWPFVHDFYAALRTYHEQQAALGQRQDFKRAGRLAPRAASGTVLARPSLEGLGAVSRRPLAPSP